MGFSGIGVIVSGAEGSRPTLNPVFYTGKTDIYNVSYLTETDLANRKENPVSSKEEIRKANIIENQLIGSVKTHTPFSSHGAVVFQGVYQDQSDHQQHDLRVTVSGIEAYCKNIYIGGLPQEFSWSGLSHTGVNYLWLSLAEINSINVGKLSSREYRQFETRSTPSLTEPVGPEKSVLVASFISGVGINPNPYGKNEFIHVKDHVNDNQNPHGPRLLQNDILCSGITVLSNYVWNSTIASGINDIKFFGLTYLNDLTQYGSLVASGLLGNILSGNLDRTLFDNAQNLEADPANVGFMTVVSGCSISGSRFRNVINILSGVTVDLLDASMLVPFVKDVCISGNVGLLTSGHTHSLILTSGISNWIEPKYPGGVLRPNSVGRRTDKMFEYNNDFGTFIPTLRHKGTTGSLFIRQYIPHGYNKVESVDVTYKVDNTAFPIQTTIRDSIGVQHTPKLGNVLSSSGLSTITLSGFPQSNMSQNMPFDIEFVFNGTSGANHYLGLIKTNFLAERA